MAWQRCWRFPPTFKLTQLISLCFFAFLAGLIDSIVVGGGLIQLPALLILLPSTAIPLVLISTSKLSSFAGTLIAAIPFSRLVKISYSIVLVAAIAAFIFSFKNCN